MMSILLDSVLSVWATITKMPEAEWHINNRKLFLTVLKAESPRSGLQHGWVLVKVHLWTADC